MFELLMRNFELEDLARTFNGDERSLELTKLTKEMVVADGIFHPQGSRYFAARNKRLQELQNLLLIVQDEGMKPHISGLNAAKMLEEELGWEKYNIVEEHIGIKELTLVQKAMQEYSQLLQQDGE